jgi:ADP-ribose pyrophosphatase YjhB (NUDIX family)
MAMSEYWKDLRCHLGHSLLLLPVVAAVIEDDRGKNLIQRRSDNLQWGLPGGLIEPGEPPAKAVVREVREETGLLVRPLRVLAVFGGARARFLYPNGDQTEPTIVIFFCKVVGGSLAMNDGESVELSWKRRDRVQEISGFLGTTLAELMATPFEWDESWLEEIGQK